MACGPVSRDRTDDGLSCPGSCGIPRSAVATSWPLSGGGEPAWVASAVSSWAGVRGRSDGDAAAAVATVTAVTTTAATRAAGTAHRDRREAFGTLIMITSPW